MSNLSHERCTAEIVVQTDLLRSHAEAADLGAPVPTCPGWSLGRLLRHLGAGHRRAEEIVRTRAARPPSDEPMRHDVDGPTDPAELGAWLAEGAAVLSNTLRAAGPDAAVWTPVAGPAGTAAFYARRFAHETLMHRADATLAVGADFTAEWDVALDAMDEWMELGSLPHLFEVLPQRRELLGPGRVLHLHATDSPGIGSGEYAAPAERATGPVDTAAPTGTAAPGLPAPGGEPRHTPGRPADLPAAEWVVDLTGDAVVWRRAHEKAAVAVRGPLVELLLLVNRRRSARDGGVEVLGDAELLDFWLERVPFG